MGINIAILAVGDQVTLIPTPTEQWHLERFSVQTVDGCVCLLTFFSGSRMACANDNRR